MLLLSYIAELCGNGQEREMFMGEASETKMQMVMKGRGKVQDAAATSGY